MPRRGRRRSDTQRRGISAREIAGIMAKIGPMIDLLTVSLCRTFRLSLPSGRQWLASVEPLSS